MPLETIRLQINTPAGPICPGRGFYQLEEEALFIQIGIFTEKKHFFNYLENEIVQFDLDREGYLIFIEIDLPRRRWETVENIHIPKRVEAADIKWLQFREELPDCNIFTNFNKSIMKIEFGKTDSPLFYYLADSVIVETDRNNNLAAIWITDITDDIAGKEIASFRKDNRLAKSYFV